jgi:DNA-binding NarL/FixJ family response regulator
MPDLNGLEAARRIQKLRQRTEILILSMHYSDQLVRDMIEAGIRGYVLKSDSDRDLLIAIEALAKHNTFFTPLATHPVLGSFSIDKTMIDRAAPTEDRLSSRQREVLQLLSEGKSSKEVASALGITLKTANTHRSNLMRKMKVHNVTHLVRYAVRNFIIEP